MVVALLVAVVAAVVLDGLVAGVFVGWVVAMLQSFHLMVVAITG